MSHSPKNSPSHFESEGLPESVYKYRFWNNKFTLSLIKNNEIFFSSFDRLNDLFDGLIPLTYTDDCYDEGRMYLKRIKLARELHPTWNEYEIQQYAYEGGMDIPLQYEEQRKISARNASKELNKYYGIFCVSSVFDNILMWSHYSNNHCGICIEFKQTELFNTLRPIVGKVEYSLNMPKFDFDDNDMEFMQKLIYTKSYDWNYEQELRYVKQGYANKKMKITQGTIKSVILGLRMNYRDRLDIIEITRKYQPQSQIYEIYASDHEFMLGKRLIYESEINSKYNILNTII